MKAKSKTNMAKSKGWRENRNVQEEKTKQTIPKPHSTDTTGSWNNVFFVFFSFHEIVDKSILIMLKRTKPINKLTRE